MYDLNQIPYNYTVEVTNTFKGLDVTERVPQELWTEVHNIVPEAVAKIAPNNKRETRRQIGSGQTRDGKSERQHSRNKRTKMDWNGSILLR